MEPLESTRRREAYYRGDTWQFWIGPRIPSTGDSQEALAELERVFQRANKIRECVDRLVNSLVAQPFTWKLSSANGKAETDVTAETLITEWLQWVDVQGTLLEGATNPPLWQAVRDLVVHGRAYLRVWMPARLASQDEYRKYALSALPPGAVICKYDEEGFPIEYRLSKQSGQEVQRLSSEGVLSVEADGDTFTYDLGGHWLVAELRGESAITQDVQDAQNAINLARTMDARNMVQAGFLERILLNAQLPGEWVQDETTPSGRRFVPSANLAVGPGRTTFVQGLPEYDDMGNIKSYSNPSVNYRDPAPSDTFAQSVAASVELIYLAFGQGHLLASDTQLAGVSRQVLRQDAELMASRYERAITTALESVLTVLLRLFGYQDLTPSVQLKKASQFVSPEEQTAIIAQYQAGLLSQYSAIARLGQVDDVDAELALIEAEAEVAAKPAQIDPLEYPQDAFTSVLADPSNSTPVGDPNQSSTTG